jgi:hypothetical protein
LLAPLFDPGVDFKDFVDNIMMLPWLQNVVISNHPSPPKKGIALLFKTGVKLATKCNL